MARDENDSETLQRKVPTQMVAQKCFAFSRDQEWLDGNVETNVGGENAERTRFCRFCEQAELCAQVCKVEGGKCNGQE